jgi:ubiquinone biosynthesis protein COQ9
LVGIGAKFAARLPSLCPRTWTVRKRAEPEYRAEPLSSAGSGWCRDDRMTENGQDSGAWAEDTEQALLDAAIAHAGKLGWTDRLTAAAAKDAGLSLGEAELLLPHGPRDLAALLARRHDTAGMAALAQIDPTSLKVRERIRQGVLARCEAAIADREAVRRWSGFLALPPNMALGLRLAWASADGIWRWAGDVAADENHYSKRALLAEILISTLAVRLALGANAAAAHLDGRIGAVMAFEKWKAGIRPSDLATRAVSFLGRLRYGAPVTGPAAATD